MDTNKNRLNLFIELKTIQAFMQKHIPENLEFQKVFEDTAYTIDIIDAPQRLFYRADRKTAELELNRRGSMYVAEEQESLSEAHLTLNQRGEVQGNAPQEIQNVMQIYLMFCLNMAVYLRENGVFAQYPDLDPEEQGVLVEENNNRIEMKLVSGNERPDLACKMFSGEVKMMRPYSSDVMLNVLLDAMPLERKEAAAEAGDTKMMQHLFEYYMGNSASPHKDLMNNMKKMEKLRKALTGESSDEAEEEEEEDTRNPEKAFYWLKKLAESGDAESAKLLSKFYSKGFGCERDFVQAVRCLDGLTEKEKSEEPLDFYRESAELYEKARAGDADAQCSYALNLAMLGRLVPSIGQDADYAEAFKWAQKSAAQNNLEGMAMLVTYYQQGVGVPKDEKKAFRLCEKAAMRGHTDSQERLARMYFDGIGTEKNADTAIEWARKAADQGDLWAMKTLLRIFVDPNGGKRDLNEAEKWARKAADLGDEEAQKILEQLRASGLSLNDSEDSENYARVKTEAENGSVTAMKQMANYYINRPGGKEDLREAYKWAKMAADFGDEDAKKMCDNLQDSFEGKLTSFKDAKRGAEAGDPSSQKLLADYYATGHETKQDLVKALYWMKKAAASGHPMFAEQAQEFVNSLEGIEDIIQKADQGDNQAKAQLAEKLFGICQAYEYHREEVGKKAQALLDEAVAAGDPHGMFVQGYLYEHGLCAAQNDNKAFELYKQSAELGNPRGELSLATFYLLGKGTPMDAEAAMEWLDKAEKHGNPEVEQTKEMLPQLMLMIAMDKLGDGEKTGGPDPLQGAKLMHYSAELGYAQAQGFLGMMYLNGNSVEEDFETGVEWLRKAAENGDQQFSDVLEECKKPEAYNAAANKEFAKKEMADKEKVFRLMKHAAEGGLAISQDTLGILYMNGVGVNADYETGMEWFRKAAAQGNTNAMKNIQKYESADGLFWGAVAAFTTYRKTGITDSSKALELLKNAAEKGSPEAMNMLGVFYADPANTATQFGVTVEQDREKAKSLFENALQIKPELKHAENNLNKLADLRDAEESGREPDKELKWAIALKKMTPGAAEAPGSSTKTPDDGNDSKQNNIEQSVTNKPMEKAPNKTEADDKQTDTEDLGKQYQRNGKCRYCGGDFKRGLFGTKCVRCGKKKDY